MSGRGPERKIFETESEELILEFPEDRDAPEVPDAAEQHETVEPAGSAIGEVDADLVIPRWQWG